jgi:hypothetical protein
MSNCPLEGWPRLSTPADEGGRFPISVVDRGTLRDSRCRDEMRVGIAVGKRIRGNEIYQLEKPVGDANDEVR